MSFLPTFLASFIRTPLSSQPVGVGERRRRVRLLLLRRRRSEAAGRLGVVPARGGAAVPLQVGADLARFLLRVG